MNASSSNTSEEPLLNAQTDLPTNDKNHQLLTKDCALVRQITPIYPTSVSLMEVNTTQPIRFSSTPPQHAGDKPQQPTNVHEQQQPHHHYQHHVMYRKEPTFEGLHTMSTFESVMPLPIHTAKEHSTHVLPCVEPQFTLYEPSLDPFICMSTIFKPNQKLAPIKGGVPSPLMSHEKKNPPIIHETDGAVSNFPPHHHPKKIVEQPHPLSTNYESINVDPVHYNQHTVLPSIPSTSSLASSSSSIHIHHPLPNGSVVNHVNARMHTSHSKPGSPVNSPLHASVPQIPNNGRMPPEPPKNGSTFSSPLIGHTSSSSFNSITQDVHPQKQLQKLDMENVKKSTSQTSLYDEDSSSPLHNEEDSNEMIEDVTLGDETMMRCSPYKKITTTDTGDVQTNHGTWSKEEHEMFLLGLKEAGRNWELIANKYIKSRVRSQVASHAQKYFKKIEKQKKMKLLKAKEAMNPSLVWSYYDYSKKN